MAEMRGGSGAALSDKGRKTKADFWNDNNTDGDADKGLGQKRSAKAGTPTSQADLKRKGNCKY